MANDKPGGKNDTAEYSATKAPDTQSHAKEQETVHDPRLKPGGAHGAPSDTGMSSIERTDETGDAPRDPHS